MVVVLENPEEYAAAVFDSMIEPTLGEDRDAAAFKQELLARLAAELDTNHPEGVTETQLMDIIQELLREIEEEEQGSQYDDAQS